jgi:hypothetical protein
MGRIFSPWTAAVRYDYDSMIQNHGCVRYDSTLLRSLC